MTDNLDRVTDLPPLATIAVLGWLALVLDVRPATQADLDAALAFAARNGWASEPVPYQPTPEGWRCEPALRPSR